MSQEIAVVDANGKNLNPQGTALDLALRLTDDQTAQHKADVAKIVAEGHGTGARAYRDILADLYHRYDSFPNQNTPYARATADAIAVVYLEYNIQHAQKAKATTVDVDLPFNNLRANGIDQAQTDFDTRETERAEKARLTAEKQSVAVEKDRIAHLSPRDLAIEQVANANGVYDYKQQLTAILNGMKFPDNMPLDQKKLLLANQGASHPEKRFAYAMADDVLDVEQGIIKQRAQEAQKAEDAKKKQEQAAHKDDNKGKADEHPKKGDHAYDKHDGHKKDDHQTHDKKGHGKKEEHHEQNGTAPVHHHTGHKPYPIGGEYEMKEGDSLSKIVRYSPLFDAAKKALGGKATESEVLDKATDVLFNLNKDALKLTDKNIIPKGTCLVVPTAAELTDGLTGKKPEIVKATPPTQKIDTALDKHELSHADTTKKTIDPVTEAQRQEIARQKEVARQARIEKETGLKDRTLAVADSKETVKDLVEGKTLNAAEQKFASLSADELPEGGRVVKELTKEQEASEAKVKEKLQHVLEVVKAELTTQDKAGKAKEPSKATVEHAAELLIAATNDLKDRKTAVGDSLLLPSDAQIKAGIEELKTNGAASDKSKKEGGFLGLGGDRQGISVGEANAPVTQNLKDVVQGKAPTGR